MRLRLNLSLRRALMAAMAVATTLASSAWAGVVDARYDQQYYLDFSYNKGMFAAGASNILVKYANGDSVTNPTISLMPNLDSYGLKGNIISIPGKGDNFSRIGGAGLVAPQYVMSASHCGETAIYFLTENEDYSTKYTSSGYHSSGGNWNTDWSIQRLNKIVTEVAYTPYASNEFMATLKVNDWLYRLGHGTFLNTDGELIDTASNALGGLVNISSITKIDANTWQIKTYLRENDISGDTRPPLEIGAYSGDSGSPVYAWDEENRCFVQVAFASASTLAAGFGNDLWARYNATETDKYIDSCSISVSEFSGDATITWSTQDAATGKGTLTQGDKSVEYVGYGTANGAAGQKGLTFTTTDTENTLTLAMQGSVNMGAGALTFDSGSWLITEAQASDTFNSAGFVVNKGASVTLNLTATANEEWRKVGAGVLTIAGEGANDVVLRVGGGTTVYDRVYDAEGNQIGWTLGNEGETRLNRQNGYAASSVRLEAGVAIIVLMADNQFKTKSVAGDTFTFGNDGGLLNLNGHKLEWGVINQDGSGTGARIGNFTPVGEETPGLATFTYTGTGTFEGCFVDESIVAGDGKAALAVTYRGGSEDKWTLTGNHSNVGGFTVEGGTMVLEGSNTPHVNMVDKNDWTYASLEGSDVTVKNGATFQLSHHAVMSGNVNVQTGGTFELNQTVNALSESVDGSLRQNMEEWKLTSLVGNVTLADDAAMLVNTNSPVATTMQGNISGTSAARFTKTGNGVFVLDGQMRLPRGTVSQGGVVVNDGTGFVGSFTRWTVGEAGFLAVKGLDNATTLACIAQGSKGVLALTSNQTTGLVLKDEYFDWSDLYIGAWGDVTYGTADASLTAYGSQETAWRLGGGTGTLTVDFKLEGGHNLYVGNQWSSGTVHLTNTGNDIGAIYIQGTGNSLTYVEGALGDAMVHMGYGNALGLYQAEQMEILSEDSQGVLALSSSLDLDLSARAGKIFSIGVIGDLTYTGTVTAADDTYRFGGLGNLTLDTVLSGASKMQLDGQGMEGSSVTFARENAYEGAITAGGALQQENAQGNIALHAGHVKALAATESVTLKQGATLYSDGQNIEVKNLTLESGSALVNNGYNTSSVTLNVDKNVTTSFADGVLNNSSSSAQLNLVKTGEGTLTMATNADWTGTLTISQGTVQGSLAVSGLFTTTGGIGSHDSVIYVEKDGVLRIDAANRQGRALGGTEILQTVLGSGTIEFSSGGSAVFSTQSQSFEGTIRLLDNTRLYVGSNLNYNGQGSYNSKRAVNNATIEVTDGSQVRITSTLFYNFTHQETINTNFIISGDGFDGSVGNTDVSGIDRLTAGALAIDCNSVVNGNITLAADAMISSSSGATLGTVNNKVTSSGNYGVAGHLGGTIRGHIGGDFTLTFGGNESMTITADSANTYGDLVIANGNGRNGGERVFALCLDAGKAENQVSTALGTGTVTLGEGLILRLAGTGVENNSDVVYTYENAMKVGNGSTLQSYNITNVLTRTVTMQGESLNLATSKGGVLQLAGGVQGSGTLNVAADSRVILGSATAGYGLTREGTSQFSGIVVAGAGADITLASASVVAAGTQFSGADSLTLRFGGTADYALGGITLSGDDSALTLHFDFSTVPSATLADSYTTLSFATGTGITASNTTIAIDLNLYNELANGTYTLIGSANSTTTYSLADSLNGRLQLDTSDGTVKLVVGADKTFYWGADGASQNWTGDANWYQPSSGSDLIAFTDGSHLVLNELGVAQDNSAAAPESIALSGTQQVGKMVVKDAVFYQLTGEGAALSGTSLVVGEGANLELSSTGTHTFTEGVYVDGATLAITAGSLAGNVTVSEGTLSVSGATVTGRIIVPDDLSGGAVLSGLNNVAPSLTVSHFADSGTTMNLTSGKLSFDQGMNINKLSLGASTEAVLQNAGLTDGLIKHIGTLEMGAGATLSLDNRTQSGTTDAADIGELVLTGSSAAIKEVYGAGHLKVGTLSMAEGVTSATLTLQKSSVSATSPYTTIFEFGSATAEAGNFVGVVNMSQNQPHSNNNNGTKHSVFVNLSGAETFANAVVKMNEQVVPNAYLGLGINAGGEGDSTTIAGLVSSESLGNRAFVFSGYAPQDINWNTGDGFDKNAGEVARTLIINTAEGAEHAFYGQIRDQLSLVKKGAGKQSFLGESSVFNGNITIEAGTLAFNSAGAGLISRAASVAVKDGATLDLSAIDFDSSVNAISISASHALTFESGATLALGDLEQNRVYNIFTSYGDLNGWNADVLSAENVTINGDQLSDTHRAGYITLLYGVDGSFSYTLESADLTWQGGTNGNWDTTTTNWDITPDVAEDATTFYQYDNVVFRDTAATTVTLSEDIVAGRVDIQDDHDHTFKGAAKSLVVDTLTSKGKVVVGAGNVFSLTINESSDIDKDLDVYWGATLNLKGLNHDINKLITRAGFSLSSAVNFNALSATIGEIEMKNNSDIVFGLAEGANSADYTVTNNINVDTNETTSRTITVEKGASLSATKLINTHGLGTLDVDGSMSLSDKLEYTNSGNKNAVAVQSITGDGSLTVGSADFANASNTLSVHTFTVNGATNINSGSLTIAGGVVNLNGTTNKTGGTLTVQGGELNFNGTTTLDSLTATGGTTNFNGATTLTSASFNGGTVNFATNNAQVGAIVRGSGNINFKLAEGLSSTTYTVGDITGTCSGNMTVDSGVTVNANSINCDGGYYAGGSRTLTVDGVLNLTGNLALAKYAASGEKITGSGILNVTGNANIVIQSGAINIDVAQLNVAGNLSLGTWAYGALHANISAGTTTVKGHLYHNSDGIPSQNDFIKLNINGGSLVMEGGATISKGELNLSSGMLHQAGDDTSTISNTFTMTGGELKVTGGTMSISSTPTVSGGAVSISGGELVFGSAEAATSMLGGVNSLTLSGTGELDLSAITFGTDATNAIALKNNAVFTFSDTLDNDGGLVFDLGTLTEGVTYQIFDLNADNTTLNGWNADILDLGNFRINGTLLSEMENAGITLGEDGTFSYTLANENNPDVLYWVGGETGTWNTTDAVWDTTPDDMEDENTVFSTDAHVAFNTSAAVDIAGSVRAASVAVEGEDTTLSLKSGSLTVADMYLEGTLDMASGVTLTVNNTEEVSISGITGSGTLVKSGSGTLELGDAELVKLSLQSDATNVTGKVTLSGQISVGAATLNIESGAVVTATQLTGGNEGNNHPSSININGGELYITGSTNYAMNNDACTGNSILLAHWNNSNTVLTLNSGKLVAASAVLNTSRDSKGTFKALGGEATLLGIDLMGHDVSERYGQFDLGTATTGSAVVTLGSGGIKNVSQGAVVNLGEGTLKASADFSIDGANTVSLIGTVNGTIFDTNAHNITVNTVLTGSGKLVKNGAGNLTFTKANTYSGATTINNGSIVLNLGTVTTGEGESAVTTNSVYTLAGSVSGAGTLQVNGGTTLQVNSTAHTVGTAVNLQEDAKWQIAAGGDYTLTKDVTGAGTLEVSTGTTLKNSGNTISSDLVLNGGHAELSGDRKISGDITINAGSVLYATGTDDALIYSSTDGDYSRTLTINAGGELNMGNRRWSMGNNASGMSASVYAIELHGGKITGQATGSGNLDFFKPGKITATGTSSEISAQMRVQNALNFVVDKAEETETTHRLTISGEIIGAGRVEKSGAGDLVFTSSQAYTGTTTISGGKLILDLGTVTTGEGESAVTTNSVYTLKNSVSGAGTLEVAAGTTLKNNGKTISSDLVLDGGHATLTGSETMEGDITVNTGGTLTFDATTTASDTLKIGTAHKLTVNEDGVVDFDKTRQTMGGWSIELNGGEIKGAGQAEWGAIDYHTALNGTDAHLIEAKKGDSVISADIRLRYLNNSSQKQDTQLKYDVAKDATLTMEGKVHSWQKTTAESTVAGYGSIIKDGEGKLIMTAANTYGGTTTIDEGTLELRGSGKLGNGDVSIASGAQLTAATTATAEAESETWASISAAEGKTATVQGATITQTQTESTKTLSIAAKTAGTQGTMTNSLVQIAADASLTVDSMIISASSRLSGAATYATRAAESESQVSKVTLNNAVVQLDSTNATLTGGTESITLGEMQSISGGNTTGALTLDAPAKVLTVSSDALSNLLVSSGSSFVVDFSSLLSDAALADVDFLYLSFENVSYADLSATTMSGTYGSETLTAYIPSVDVPQVNLPQVGAYFDVRYIPEPTTTTLSILALAALAARRRRK